MNGLPDASLPLALSIYWVVAVFNLFVWILQFALFSIFSLGFVLRIKSLFAIYHLGCARLSLWPFGHLGKYTHKLHCRCVLARCSKSRKSSSTKFADCSYSSRFINGSLINCGYWPFLLSFRDCISPSDTVIGTVHLTWLLCYTRILFEISLSSFRDRCLHHDYLLRWWLHPSKRWSSLLAASAFVWYRFVLQATIKIPIFPF